MRALREFAHGRAVAPDVRAPGRTDRAAARMSSIVVVDRLETIIGTSAAAAARAVASSPSGWAIRWSAVGAMPTGMALGPSRSVHSVVRADTSRITRCQSRSRPHAAMFSASVDSPHAPLRK
jgi:hypothetical protein